MSRSDSAIASCRSWPARVLTGILPLLLLALLIPGCFRRQSKGSAESTDLPQARFERAQKEWQQGELSSGYSAFLGLPPSTAQGQQARKQIDAAAVHYRRALELILAGQPGAREELQRGKALGPMDPALFLPLARACRQKDNSFLAVKYYRSYLAAAPSPPDADASAAQKELLEVVREVGDIGVIPAAERSPNANPLSRIPPTALLIIGTALGLILAALLSSLSTLGQWARRGRSLAALAEAYPELQPALAYLVGRLRHELLKHRIGAAADVAQSLYSGQSSAELRVFLHKKLYGGERLDEAWRSYLHSFRRALGPDFDLARSDRAFASAERAVKALQRLELPLLRGERSAVKKLVVAHKKLQDFDRGLAELMSRLQRTPLDRELLTQALNTVRSEHLASKVTLDSVEINEPSEPVFVAVYRTDLLLILKNILRNAILAVGRGPTPRMIAIDVQLDLLPTGEEMVRLGVHDTSPEPLTAEQIYRTTDAEAGNVQHGLGLVTAALSLYSGSIAVMPGKAGYSKCVAVQLFRTLGPEVVT